MRAEIKGNGVLQATVKYQANKSTRIFQYGRLRTQRNETRTLLEVSIDPQWNTQLKEEQTQQGNKW